MMHRFGDQIEFRVDRRYVLLFFMGAVCWTLVTFLFGMLVASNGKQRLGEKGLMTLGWLDKRAAKRHLAAPSGFVFTPHARPRPRVRQKPTPAHVGESRRRVERPQVQEASQPVARRPVVRPPAVRVRVAPPPPVIRRVKPPEIRVAAMPKLRLQVSGARYGVELRFLNSRKAAKMKRDLWKKRIRTEIALTRHPKRGRYYRLLLGRFRTFSGAVRAWRKLGLRGQKGGVIRLRP
jgi:hypothetical protein